MRDILLSGLGILRDEDGLTNALTGLEQLPGSSGQTDEKRRMLGEAMLLSARERRESRGAHSRTDYPERDDEHFRKTTVVTFRDGEIDLRYQAIGKGNGID